MSGYVCYLRVSTQHQVDRGISLDAQKTICLDGIRKLEPDTDITYALYDGTGELLDGEVRTPRNGEIHVKLYQDAGVSGAAPLDESPALRAALDALPRGGNLVVAKLDRLDRDDFKAAFVDQWLADRKARLISIAGEGTEGTKPYHVLLRDILKAVRKHERLITKERMRAAINERKRQRLVVGQIPRGYSLAPDGKHIEERTVSEFEVVQKIIDLWKSGRTLDEITATLRDLPGGYRSRNGRFLSKEQVRQVVMRHVPSYREQK